MSSFLKDSYVDRYVDIETHATCYMQHVHVIVYISKTCVHVHASPITYIIYVKSLLDLRHFEFSKLLRWKRFLFYKENTQRSPWLVMTKSILRNYKCCLYLLWIVLDWHNYTSVHTNIPTINRSLIPFARFPKS